MWTEASNIWVHYYLEVVKAKKIHGLGRKMAQPVIYSVATHSSFRNALNFKCGEKYIAKISLLFHNEKWNWQLFHSQIGKRSIWEDSKELSGSQFDNYSVTSATLIMSDQSCTVDLILEDFKFKNGCSLGIRFLATNEKNSSARKMISRYRF